MPDSNHELPTSQREMSTSAPSGASCTGSNAPGVPARGWPEQPGATGHRSGRLRPRADHSQEGIGRPNRWRGDVSAPVSQSHASACTSPAVE